MKDKYEQRITVAVEDDSDSWRAHLLLEQYRDTLADAVERLAKVEALTTDSQSLAPKPS